MKKLRRLFLALICTGGAAATYAHSPMFEDFYVFDESNGGEGMTPQLLEMMGDFGVTAALTTCSGGMAAGFPCKNVDMQSFIAKAALGAETPSINLNDNWGWVDPVTGNEIAIVGLTNGTSFVDVTDPVRPVVLGKLDARGGGAAVWRDIKVYRDHAFIVGDRPTKGGLQVFDLRQLRDIVNPPVKLQETAGDSSFGKAHNIHINEDTGYAYVVGSDVCSGGLFMIDISNPARPGRGTCFSADGYTHDAQCVSYNGPDARYRNREICVGYNEDTVTIVDVTDKNAPVQISRTSYEGQRYTHQGWFLNDDHRILITDDELDESRSGVNTTSYIFDVSDLTKPVQIGKFVGPTQAIDHNLYSMENPAGGGEVVVEANYRAGVRIMSANEVSQGKMVERAFFDVIPASNEARFSGTWSTYIYFPSGNIIASDIGNGLFVLRPDWEAIAREVGAKR